MNIAKLKGKMAEKGISQRKLAELIGVRVNTLNTRFTGKREFDLRDVEAICKVLQIIDPYEIASIFSPTVSKIRRNDRP